MQERDLWGGLGVDGRTILEWTLKRLENNYNQGLQGLFLTVIFGIYFGFYSKDLILEIVSIYYVNLLGYSPLIINN